MYFSCTYSKSAASTRLEKHPILLKPPPSLSPSSLYSFCHLPEITEDALANEMHEAGLAKDEEPFRKQYRCIFGWVAQTTYVLVLLFFSFLSLVFESKKLINFWCWFSLGFLFLCVCVCVWGGELELFTEVHKSRLRLSLWIISLSKESESHSQELRSCFPSVKLRLRLVGKFIFHPIVRYREKNKLRGKSLIVPSYPDSSVLSFWTG